MISRLCKLASERQEWLKKHWAKVAAAMEKELPIGQEVRWSTNHASGAHIQRGVVTHHGYYGRIQVRNHKTGKVTWLGASEVAPL